MVRTMNFAAQTLAGKSLHRVQAVQQGHRQVGQIPGSASVSDANSVSSLPVRGDPHHIVIGSQQGAKALGEELVVVGY